MSVQLKDFASLNCLKELLTFNSICFTEIWFGVNVIRLGHDHCFLLNFFKAGAPPLTSKIVWR